MNYASCSLNSHSLMIILCDVLIKLEDEIKCVYTEPSESKDLTISGTHVDKLWSSPSLLTIFICYQQVIIFLYLFTHKY
jgi:hypothetical protein